MRYFNTDSVCFGMPLGCRISREFYSKELAQLAGGI